MVSLNRNQYISKSLAIIKAKALTILMQQQNELIQIRAESSLTSRKFYQDSCDIGLAICLSTRKKIHEKMHDALLQLCLDSQMYIDLQRLEKLVNIHLHQIQKMECKSHIVNERFYLEMLTFLKSNIRFKEALLKY